MSYTPKRISEVVTEYLNKTTFLPAIQREFVWEPYGIEKLFDSIMGDYPIGTFLFWKIKEENKNQWTAYEFIRDFDEENPHNKEANVSGLNQDIYLVLDGQQRLTSLLIGLKGSFRFFHYRWRKSRLYLNLLKEPTKGDNPEELTYQFQFRENNQPNGKDASPQYWYLVGDILNYDDAEDAKDGIKKQLAGFTDQQQETARRHIGRLHSKLHVASLLNYYEEKSQDYDKVVEAFIRANTGGTKLEYSDILLSTATAKWDKLNAREEIHSFTDELNQTGNGYRFDKDFVLKGCLYLTESLPIQYKVKNFNRPNLEKIEQNWEQIKLNLTSTVKLVSKFGYGDKNLVAKMALLPIALYLGRSSSKNIVDSTDKNDVQNQIAIQKWLTLALLKNAFGGSSDTTLSNAREVIVSNTNGNGFPHAEINKRLGVESSFTDAEIDSLLLTGYSSKYSYLILSLLYPDRDWKDKKHHEDHIFPKSEFTTAKLRQRGYDDKKIAEYQRHFNCIVNLQLLTDSENLEKSAKDFETWFAARDRNFKDRHKIPAVQSYGFDNFLDFVGERRKEIVTALKAFSLA